MHHGLTMPAVRVSRTALLAKLRENLQKHEAEFKEADAGFRAALAKRLQAMLKAARSAAAAKDCDMHVGLPVPNSFAEDYQTAIQMLDMAQDAEIELNQQQFRCFVMDEWDWKEQFANTSSIYAAGAAKKARR